MNEMSLSSNKYQLSCCICKKKNGVSLLPHKHEDGSFAGMIVVCDQHLDELVTRTIRIDYDPPKSEEVIQKTTYNNRMVQCPYHKEGKWSCSLGMEEFCEKSPCMLKVAQNHT